MAQIFPAGTNSIRNLTPRFYYFLVVKPDGLVDDIPQKEYFVYRFKVPVSDKDGIKELKKYFSGTQLIVCRSLSDIEYATGNFVHPDYINQNKSPLTFKLREIPIYIQSQIRVINLEKDPYQYGSKPIIRDNTSTIKDDLFFKRVGGAPLINEL
jgi:hypothetical protein